MARTVLPGGAYCCLTWSDDGDWIYFTNADRGVSRLSPRGGDPEVLTTVEGDADHLWPHPVPGTELVVFELYELFGIDSRLALLHAASREFEEIGEGSYPTPMGDLMLFTSADGTELRYSRLGAAQTVAATTIVTGMVGGTVGVGLALIRPRYDASSTGDLVYVTGGASAARLGMPVWMERDGTETPIDSTLTGYFRKLRLSPDGSRLLISDMEGMVIHVKDLPTGPLVPITRDGTVNYRPSWAPDNSAVFYSSNRSGEDARDIEVFRVRPDGAGEPEAVGLPFPAALMTRDGQWWIYRTSNIAPDRGNLMAVRVDGSSDPIDLVATDAAEGQPTISRDGRWFAYSSDISGVRQVYRSRPRRTSCSWWRAGGWSR